MITMRILVTGGLGFIGSNFCRYILTKYPDYELINLDKMGIGANPASLLDFENNPNYRFIRGDVCNIPLLHKTISHVDAVVNFAAETHVDRSISDPYTFVQNNTIGTFTVLRERSAISFKSLLCIKSCSRHVCFVVLQNVQT